MEVEELTGGSFEFPTEHVISPDLTSEMNPLSGLVARTIRRGCQRKRLNSLVLWGRVDETVVVYLRFRISILVGVKRQLPFQLNRQGKPEFTCLNIPSR